MPAEVGISGAKAEKASVAESRNEATMTSSARPKRRSRAARRLLVGGDHRRGLLDVEIEHHPGELLEHLLQEGDAEAVVLRGPAPERVAVGVEARARRRHPAPTSRRCPGRASSP